MPAAEEKWREAELAVRKAKLENNYAEFKVGGAESTKTRSARRIHIHLVERIW